MSKEIFVGNLDFEIRDEKLEELFSEFGEIENANVILDKNDKRKSKGFGFVTFVNSEDAEKAVSEMNEKEVNGRKITVNIAKEKTEDSRPRRSFGHNERSMPKDNMYWTTRELN